jgi:heme exporter protein D
MRNLDFSSWQTLLSTLLGLAVVTLIAVGMRLIVMQSIQQRRERENRQINERLRTLIAAYKTLGGSFTGDLVVSPVHLSDLRRRTEPARSLDVSTAAGLSEDVAGESASSTDRSRRIRDAVEAALSDIILLGTEEQVRLAADAATALAAGRDVRTDELVMSLRSFIRKVLDLEAIPPAVSIPKQGPARPSGRGGQSDGAGRERGRENAGRGGGAGAGMGAGAGLGLGLGGHRLFTEEEEDEAKDREE